MSNPTADTESSVNIGDRVPAAVMKLISLTKDIECKAAAWSQPYDVDKLLRGKIEKLQFIDREPGEGFKTLTLENMKGLST